MSTASFTGPLETIQLNDLYSRAPSGNQSYNKNSPFLVIAAMILVSAYFVKNPGGEMGANIITSDNILKAFRQHLSLVLAATIISIFTAVPLGVFITRKKFKKAGTIIINIVNIGQTIPSIAVIGLVMGILGLGFKTAVFALWVYSLLPILRNTFTGLMNVDLSVIDAAQGMGMTKTQILFKVELPLALYVIFAGVRTATVVNVGTAALATFIGAGGLGDFIVTGISMMRNQILLTGAVLTALLAILMDYILGKLEKAMVV